MEVDTTVMDMLLMILAEVFGTAILIFVGCMACVGSMGMAPTLMHISLAFGIAVMIAIQCVGHISGAHINPSITVAAVILGNKSLPLAGLYIIAQCLGSLTGYGVLKAITPQYLLHGGNLTAADSFCMTDINQNLTPIHGIAAEMLATGILVFFACGIWDSRNKHDTDSVAIKFGLCVTVLCLAFVPYTGCSLNPARTFGPAVWNGYWTHHWIYWIGPIAGAIIAATIYRYLFSPKTNRRDTTRHAETLNGMET
ncbi:Aquaporin-4 [Ooceraea biroi]|nr:Aquaporin-4 [Ooceraea biroi]